MLSVSAVRPGDISNFVQASPMQIVTLPIEPNCPKRFYRIVTP